ncbi:hypothetical protein JR316_0003372 [Psilocybe cubensis]|uniref:Uncharacterized protein n=2 Tax=Psilocybe cubensis TaxID=181762 RepID=A0ACB8H7T5_PSICU|nr:hypothetical protein JR316_0003372 [Psilocybe cubensis]KAH9483894.1 hypothetical protein JR316_0003372 [Psilocybe cubensis]
MAPFFSVPPSIVAFNAHFPLKTYPPIKSSNKVHIDAPTLWIHPPRSTSQPIDNLLSSDVECLKWQAYLALRNLRNVKLRWDISPDGSIDGALPNLHVPISDALSIAQKPTTNGAEDGELLAAHSIPSWVDAKLGVDSSSDPLEGYKDSAARVESRAWVSLLEGVVHAALLTSTPTPSYIHSLLFPKPMPPISESLQKILSPPPAPLTGLCSLIPPSGARINTSAILSQYKDAIASLSDRLGTDNWFLSSQEPTPLDALAFAYLHSILHSSDIVRIEVTRRVNLVAWEWKVRRIVREAFVI